MLARLRNTLDFMPSPYEDKPGLILRDPFQFSDATLIVPPALIECLEYFDGQHSSLDLHAHLVRLAGDLRAGEIADQLATALSNAGFLEDEAFLHKKAEAERAFAAAATREPAHSGSAYPDEPEELRKTFREYLSPSGAQAPAESRRAIAIAAPHVSPFGGIDAYRAAYNALSPEDADRTFVVLGTSHYGHPDRVGLTRKPFVTPYGETIPALDLIERLEREAGGGAFMEDYCHSIEHSIEFQVVFLQHLFGPRIRVMPVLCGSYLRGIYEGVMPEENEDVKRAIGALGELAAREGDRLLWVLGVDMAHMGRRYGDSLIATAGQAEMQEVERRDRGRISRMEAGDAQGFWELIQENQDDLKWCGSSPIYTFLRAIPHARGTLRQYQQWNIDEASVVSFAGMSFH